MKKDLCVGVVGLGLIGGSLALSLKGKVREVRGLDINEEVLEIAEKRQIADVLSSRVEEILPFCDVIYVSLYPRQTKGFILNNMEHFKNRALIMDVSGIKEKVVKDIQNNLRDDLEFLGTHPMAGAEGEGITQAREELFLGSYYLITPTEKNSEAAISLAEELSTLMGVRKNVHISVEEHDKIISYTSQLPHIVAIALIAGFSEEHRFMIGGSFKDGTRVARVNEELWTELFLENKENLLKEIETFKKNLQIIEDAIAAEDKEALINYFKRVRNIKESI